MDQIHGKLEKLEQRILSRERISDDDALLLYSDAPLETLSRWATTVRSRLHDPQRASYVIMRIINYTNICVAYCDYCAFYRLPNSPEGYILSYQQIRAKVDELLELGGELVGFNGGFHPQLKISWYADLFAKLRADYGDRIEFYAMTVAELMYAAKRSKLSYYDAAKMLTDNGVRWITGGGSEILTNGFRKRHSPLKYTADEYCEAHREIIRAGVNSTATMVIGFDETLEERVEHLRRVRELQDQTDGGLFSFLSWTYKPHNTELGGLEIGQEEYLRHLAVARIYLDNIRHIRTSVLTQNENALRGLRFGADDFDIPIEDQVTQLAGAVISQDISGILEQAKHQGFRPELRKVAGVYARPHATLQRLNASCSNGARP